MNNSQVLIRKELLQLWRCKKILILLITACFIAAISPLLAKYMPELLRMMVTASGQNAVIELPEPTFIDAYSQLFKNMDFIGMFIIILVFSGTIVEERTGGTAVLVLTKNVTRTQFIICKFLSDVIAFIVVYLVFATVFFAYSNFLFSDFPADRFILAFLAYLSYFLFLIGVTAFASTLGKSFTITALVAFIVFFGTSLTRFIPHVKSYTPGNITGIIHEMLEGSVSGGDLWYPSIIAVVIAVLLVFLSTVIFNKQEDI